MKYFYNFYSNGKLLTGFANKNELKLEKELKLEFDNNKWVTYDILNIEKKRIKGKFIDKNKPCFVRTIFNVNLKEQKEND
jgi:hypothetical protein